VRALGEEPWRIHVTGLPSLDGIEERAATRAELVAQGLIPQRAPFILASYFPVTMQAQESRQLLDMWLESLNRLDVHKLIIRANADAGANDYAAAIDAWAEETKDATIVASLTPSLYLAALRETACYVGNSSCGLIEAPLLGTPVVMLGTRQEGRLAGPHAVVLRSPTVDELVAAVQAQVAHGPYRGLTSPWGDGAASGRICDALASMRSLPELLIKRLVHSAGASASATAPRRDVKTAARIEPSVAVQLLKHEAIV
jgi:UDP-N-acetylglucosamine 2-epimerase